MRRVTDRIKSPLLRGAAVGAVGLAEESFIVEASQDAIPVLVQDIAHELDPQIPDAKWRNGRDGYLDGWWSRYTIVAGSMAPFMILGPLRAAERQQARYTAFRTMSDDQLAAAGLSAEQRATLREGLERGPSSGIAAIDAVWDARTPFSDEAKAAAEKIAAEEQAKTDAYERAVQAGTFPRITQNENGWLLRDPTTGAEILRTSTAEDAMRAAGIWQKENGHPPLALPTSENPDASQENHDAAHAPIVDSRDHTAFELAPSTPERDARKITPLKIPSQVLPGSKKDWHLAVRKYIAEHLQGKSFTNKDSGTEIHFNSESKGEAPSKLRREPGYRAATHIGDITVDAIHIGYTPPGENKQNSTKQIDYFALPVMIDGGHAVAWFNTRTAKFGEKVVFYEFGLFDPIISTSQNHAARTAQGLGKQTQSPTSNAPQSGPDETIAEFIDRIKETLPAGIKVAYPDGRPFADHDLGTSAPDLPGTPPAPLTSAEQKQVLDEVGPQIAADLGRPELADAFRPATATEIRRAGAMLRLSQDIAGLFGKRIIVFSPIKGGPTGFVNSAHPGIIFLSAHNLRPHLFTTGHELWHHLQNDHPELADRVRKLIEPLVTRRAELAKEKAGYKPDQHLDELIGDHLGDNLSRPEFWEGLAAKQPGLFREVADVITRWLDNVLNKLRRLGYGSDRYFTDIKQVRDILTDAVAEYAEMRNAENPFNSKEPDQFHSDASSKSSIYYSLSNDDARRLRQEIESQTPLRITTSNIPPMPTPSAVKAWALANDVFGDTHHSKIAGPVTIANSSLKSEIAHRLPAKKAASLQKMKELIPLSTYLEGRRRKIDVLSHRLAGVIEIDGTTYIARIVIDEDRNGRRLYNHELSDLKELQMKRPQPLQSGGNLDDQQLGWQEFEDTRSLLQWIFSVK